MSLQYSELRPTSGWDHFVSSGHPSKFQRVSRLGSVTARHCIVVGVSEILRRWTDGDTYIRQGGHITLDIDPHSSLRIVLLVNSSCRFCRNLLTFIVYGWSCMSTKYQVRERRPDGNQQSVASSWEDVRTVCTIEMEDKMRRTVAAEIQTASDCCGHSVIVDEIQCHAKHVEHYQRSCCLRPA